jgi:hypothetical protein
MNAGGDDPGDRRRAGARGGWRRRGQENSAARGRLRERIRRAIRARASESRSRRGSRPGFVRWNSLGRARGHFGRGATRRRGSDPTTTRTAARFTTIRLYRQRGRHHAQRRGGGAVRSNLLPLRTRSDTKERPKILVEDSAGFGGQAPHTLLLHTVLVHTSITPAQPSSSVQRFSCAFGAGPHFHLSFLVAAGGAVVESSAGGPGHWVAHSNRRADSGDALAATHRCVFFT